MINLFKRLIRDEEGQGLAEYALILAGIAIVVIAVLIALGTNIQNIFTRISDNLAELPNQ